MALSGDLNIKRDTLMWAKKQVGKEIREKWEKEMKNDYNIFRGLTLEGHLALLEGLMYVANR
jgi:hypothetical protein